MVWEDKIADNLVRSGTDKLEGIVEKSVIDYLQLFNSDSITDPYKLAYAIVELYGPAVIERSDVRKLLYEHIDENVLVQIAKIFNLENNSLPEIVNLLVNKGWQWGSSFAKEIIKILNIVEIEDAYHQSLDNDDEIALPDYCQKLDEVNNFYELHSFQTQLKEDVINNIHNDVRKNLVRLPTGGGKTRVAVHTLSSIISKNKDNGFRRYLWLTYEPLLAAQACETFLDVYKILGSVELKVSKLFYNYSQFNELNSNEVMFANITSLNNLLSTSEDVRSFANEVDTIVFDEVHQVKAPIAFSLITRLLECNKNINFIGLTATPGRGDLSGDDSSGLMKFFDEKVEVRVPPAPQLYGDIDSINKNEKNRTAITYLQELGVLANLHEIKLNYSERPEYTPTKDPLRNKKIIDCIYERLDKNEKIVVFAASAEHAKLLSILLKAENIRIGLVLGENRRFREKLIRDFRKGDLNILITYEVLTTGFDAPEIDSLIITRPTKSIVTYSQILGRALRGRLNGGHDRNTIINISDPKFGDVNEVYKEFSEYWSES